MVTAVSTRNQTIPMSYTGFARSATAAATGELPELRVSCGGKEMSGVYYLVSSGERGYMVSGKSPYIIEALTHQLKRREDYSQNQTFNNKLCQSDIGINLTTA